MIPQETKNRAKVVRLVSIEHQRYDFSNQTVDYEEDAVCVRPGQGPSTDNSSAGTGSDKQEDGSKVAAH